MKYFLFLILACFGHSTIQAQSDSSGIDFIAYWAIGDAYDFRITKMDKAWKDGVQTRNDSFQYIARFEVIDSTADSYKIKWSYKTTLLSNYDLAPEITDQLAKYELTEVIYTTTELGAFVGVENWEAISKMMEEMLGGIIDFYSKSDTKIKEQMEKICKPLIDAYKSKEGIETTLLAEISYFHFPFGAHFETDDVLTYEDQISNLFGGDPIKCNSTLYFDDVDFDDAYCSFIQEIRVDTKEGRKFMEDSFKKMGLNDKKTRKELKKAKFGILRNNRYEFYYDPGIPIKIEVYNASDIEIGDLAKRLLKEIRIELMEN